MSNRVGSRSEKLWKVPGWVIFQRPPENENLNEKEYIQSFRACDEIVYIYKYIPIYSYLAVSLLQAIAIKLTYINI